MMEDSDHESTSNTDDLVSGIYRLDDISPLPSPRTPDRNLRRARKTMSEDMDSGQGSRTETPDGTCFDKSNPNTVKARPVSPRSRSLSPQSRIRVHYTDSAREALDLANKSYEKLVEESDERHHLTILINKRDAERAELERQERERAETRAREKLPVKPANLASTKSPVLGEERFAEPITVIQEHIRFAESILASPTNSDSNKRSRSLSPLHYNRVPSPTQHSPWSPGNRSRSNSPLTRPNGHPNSLSSRKKLSFEGGERRVKSPLLTRSGREKTAQEIKTRPSQFNSQVTNDYIEATSHGFRKHPPHDSRITAERMAAVTSVRSHDADSRRDSPFNDIYNTPEKSKQLSSLRTGPLSSTPHRHGHREPMRELSPSRLYDSEQQPAKPKRDEHVEERPSVSTPSAYIKGLQSVRSGLRKLMSDDADAAEELSVDASSRADNVSLRIESTINAENQLLRDQLTRERNLRKQIEADKHELQAQLLESKDRLHHLSTTLKQKEGVMKKLDQNLDDVVRGWQKHEQENKQRSESLTHNIRRLERTSEEQKIHAAGLENDLAAAVKDVKREKESNKNLVREASEHQLRLQEEISDMRNVLEREQEKSLRLELERAQATEGRVHLERQLRNLQETLDQERDNFKEREQELLNKINEITSVQIAVLEQEAARTKAQAEKIDELDTKARRFEQEAESQRHLVSSKSKEVERLQSLLELTDAKHQNALRQLESKLRIELELRVSQAKDDGLKRLADNEINLQQAHQRQLADVVSEHNRQLGAMRERFNNELNRVKNQFDDQMRSAESNLDETRQELETVLSVKEAAETQRDDLTSRLQAVLTLLGPAAEGQTVIPPHITSSSHYRPISSFHSHDIHHHAPPVHQFTPSKQHPVIDVSPVTPQRPPPPQNDPSSTPLKSGDPNITSYTDSTANTGDDDNTPQTLLKPVQNPDYHPMTDEEPAEHQVDEEKEEGDDSSVVSYTETFDLNDNDSEYRHKRQAELQDYIKKLLNRSVGDPLIETRIDLDESHISVISGLQDHSVILHDATHEHHGSPKKAFKHEMVGQTPPVKGSSKKVDPKEIASLISKYGGENATPSTAEYIEYLKSVAVNNHTGFLKEFDRKRKPPAAAKKDLSDKFNTSTYLATHRRTTSNSRLKPSSPDKTTISRQAKEKDKPRVKRHSNTRSQAIWK